MKKEDKRGTNLLIGNVVFIILNLVFLSILIAFLISKTSAVADMEEEYAKQIALMIDASKPGMEITMTMKKAFEKADKENYEGDLISFNDNIVTVKLKEGKGYSYSFFNNVKVGNIIKNKDEFFYSFEVYENE